MATHVSISMDDAASSSVHGDCVYGSITVDVNRGVGPSTSGPQRCPGFKGEGCYQILRESSPYALCKGCARAIINDLARTRASRGVGFDSATCSGDSFGSVRRSVTDGNGSTLLTNTAVRCHRTSNSITVHVDLGGSSSDKSRRYCLGFTGNGCQKSLNPWWPYPVCTRCAQAIIDELAEEKVPYTVPGIYAAGLCHSHGDAQLELFEAVDVLSSEAAERSVVQGVIGNGVEDFEIVVEAQFDS
jgi:hypothetical protein